MDYQYIGDCHHIAVALSELKGLPIMVFYGEREWDEVDEVEMCEECGGWQSCSSCEDFEDFDEYIKDMESGTQYILIHCGVLDKGSFRDLSGLCGDPKNALEEYISGNDPYDITDIIVFENPYDPAFMNILEKCEASFDSAKVEAFKEKILKMDPR